MSSVSEWLKKLKVGSKNAFHNWLMEEVGYETYLNNQLWDDASLLHYIIVTRDDNLYLKWQNENEKLHRVDFSKRKQHEVNT